MCADRNFSRVPNRVGEQINSRVFEIGGVAWSIMLYPQGEIRPFLDTSIVAVVRHNFAQGMSVSYSASNYRHPVRVQHPLSKADSPIGGQVSETKDACQYF
jgi:hypothetical protein